jgi:hypothetical protein
VLGPALIRVALARFFLVLAQLFACSTASPG